MRLSGWIPVLLICSFIVGCGGRPKPSGPNVLLVSFDTTRADHIGAYGYESAHTPNVDRLAREGVLFEQAITTVPITLPAHSSMMTGLYPFNHGVRNNGSYALRKDQITLAEVLYGKGYDTAAFVSAYVLDAQYGLSQGFMVYDDRVHDSTVVILIDERQADETTDRVLEWLEEKRDRPFFLFIHYFDPHQGYWPPAKWRDRFPDDPYSGEIAFADEQLGRVLERINLDETMVIFTADHGDGMGEHGELTHAYLAYDSTMHVPLIVRYPDGRDAGKRVGKQTSVVDIFPTVMEFLGYPIPKNVAYDGRSLLDLEQYAKIDRKVYFETTYPLAFEWAPLVGLRSEEWKYTKAPISELYRVSEDPKELTNVIEEFPRIARQLDLDLEAMNPLESLRNARSQKKVSAEERERLAALGYLGNTDLSALGNVDFYSLPDPKDMLPVYLRVSQSRSMYAAGMYDETKTLLASILKKYPDMMQARFLLGRIYMELEQYDEACEILEQALHLRPDDNAVWFALAVSYNKAELYDRAIKICQDGIEAFPHEAGLYDQLGLAYQLKEDYQRAIRFGRESVQRSDTRPEFWNNLGASYLAAGEYSKARQALEKALNLRPEFSQALFNLGVVGLHSKDYRLAERNLRKAVKVNEGNYEAWTQLNKAVLYQRGRIPEALEISRKLLEMKPEDPAPYYFMSVAYRQGEDFENAAFVLRKYLEENPGFSPGYQELVEVLLAQQPARKDQARQVAEDALSRGVNIPSNLRQRVGM